MNRKRIFLAVVFMITLFVPCISGAENEQDLSATIKLFEDSWAVKPFFVNAYGYAVFPSIGKGGFIVGGA